MTIILSIIVLVAIVSLYDYFGSRSWQQVTSSVRNNVVFENRNRDYGAFVIRRDYDKTLLVIMVSMVFSVGGIYAAYAGFSSLPEDEIIAKKLITEDITPLFIPVKDKPDEIIKDEIVKPTSAEKMDKFTKPEVSDDKVKNDLKTQEELDKSKVGPVDTEKKGDGLTTTVVKVIVPEKKEDEKPKGPEVNVDIEAQFPGGVLEMIRHIQKKLVYPQIAVENGYTGKCYLQFVVDTEGKISSVKVLRGVPSCPECDKEAIRVLKAMPNWNPGKIKGKDVSSYFTMPIDFQLE
jgi:protein TonB